MLKSKKDIEKAGIKNTGGLFPKVNELDLFRQFFVEGANLQGRHGYLYEVDEEKTLNLDTQYAHKAAKEVSYYLVENPQKSLLMKYGWYTEDKNRLPILCYLTFLDKDMKPIEPSEGALLELSTRARPHTKDIETRKFMIVGVYTDLEMNQFVCNLVPYRENIKPYNIIPSDADRIVENKWLKRKTIGPEDLLGDGNIEVDADYVRDKSSND